MDEYGSLHLQMLTVLCAKAERRQSASPDTPKVDLRPGTPDRETIPCGNDREPAGKRTPEAVHRRTGGRLYPQREGAGSKGQAGAFPPKAYWPALLQVFADDELEAAETENAVEITWA